jgi:hypothetical protein
LEAAGVELDKTGAVKVSSFSVIQLVLSIELHVITLVRAKNRCQFQHYYSSFFCKFLSL